VLTWAVDFVEGARQSGAPAGAGVVLGDLEADHLRLTFGPADEGPEPGDAWLPVRVEVRAGVFRAAAEATLLASELRRFRDGLAGLPADPRGRAALLTEDGWLAVRLFGDGFGHVDARCELRDPEAVLHHLEFTVGLNARDLDPVLAAVEAALSEAGR
jgi:hypothetical protein